ncbi:MAG: hypothetical protein A2Z20_06940 [Bdellovibrionales bacterium RBG_16_40_8]|nr:MAG: hypothetical protein A2Z20_06940 [Bdellovibrionales bacterium RBG_16_40_8]
MRRVAFFIAIISLAGASNAFAQSAAAKAASAAAKGARVAPRVVESAGKTAAETALGATSQISKIAPIGGLTNQGTAGSRMNLSATDEQAAKLLGGKCSAMPSGLSAAEVAILNASSTAGVGAYGCITQKFDTKTAGTAVRVQNAGLQTLKGMGKTVVDSLNARQVGMAMATEIERTLGLESGEGLERLKQLCSNDCDVSSATICAAIN